MPPELLLHIAKDLEPDETSISILSRVCRATYAAMSPFLYKAQQAGLIALDREYPDAWYYAVQNGRTDTVRRLLEAGMDVNKYRGKVPLVMAIHNKKMEIIQLLLERGADVDNIPHDPGGQTALEAAVNVGYFEAVDTLLDHGATLGPINGRGSSIMACCFSYKENWDMFEYLLGKGADVDMRDRQGNSALSAAVQQGKVEIAIWPLEHGADIHQRGPRIWPRGLDSLLGVAKTHHQPSEEMIDMLKRYGAID